MKTLTGIFNFKQYALSLLLIALPFFVVNNLTAEEKRTVRVGFYQYEGLHDISKDGQLSGYGYDYTLAVAQYANWNVEFITGYSFQQYLKMLKNNQIDLLGSLVKSPERLKYFAFSQTSTGYETGSLLALKNSKYSYENFSAFDGMRVGLIEGYALNNKFFIYCQKNNFRVQTKKYAYNTDARQALESGKIDALLLADLLHTNNYKMIANFDSLPRYFAVNKKNKVLLKELNKSLTRLKIYSPYFNDLLNAKYSSYSSKNAISFSVEELAYIQQKKVVNVAYLKNYRPISWQNKKGQAQGIAIDLLRQISQFSGLKFEYHSFEQADSDFKGYLIENEILAAVQYDFNWAKKNNVYLVPPYLQCSYVVLYPDYPKKKDYANASLALQKDYYISQLIGLNFKINPNQIKYYLSFEESLEAVRKGHADYAFANSYEANYFLTQPKNRHLTFSVLQIEPQKLAFAISKEEKILLSIINKTLQNISEVEISNIIQNNLQKKKKFSVLDLIYETPLVFSIMVVIVIIFLFSLILLIYLFYYNKKKNKILEQANNAKSDFLSRVSHDIRTPLNVILSYSDKDVVDNMTDENVPLYLQKINNSGKYLFCLINDILDISKFENNKIEIREEPIKLSKLISRVEDIISSQMKYKNITFIIDILAEDANKTLNLDVVHVQQILMNLLNNAVKFTPEYGKVWWKISVEPLDDKKVSLIISVKNTGSYISLDQQKKIFEPFEQGRNFLPAQGSGLGLSIVRSFVDLMNGIVKVKSSIEEGTEFTVILDCLLISQDSVGKQKTAENFSNLNNLIDKRILLCEDNSLNVDIVKIYLEELGVKIDVAENGKVGLDKFLNSSASYYDLILMDVKMPLMDGLEATKLIRQAEHPDAQKIPILAMTANAFAKDIQDCLDAGMNEHLAKPIDVQHLITTFYKFLK